MKESVAAIEKAHIVEIQRMHVLVYSFHPPLSLCSCLCVFECASAWSLLLAVSCLLSVSRV